MDKNSKIADNKLLKAYLDGNDDCFEMLLNRHKDKIFTSIFMIVHNTYVAEDIFQETFIKIIKTLKSGKYNEEGKFLPWAIRIAKNLAIDHFRRQKKMPTVVNEEGKDIFNILPFADENREQTIINEEKRNTLRELIKELPYEQREVLVLRHYGDLSFKEIAKITNVSINTALGRMRYALNNMRKIIEEKSINF